jgi:hypothetical protein
MLAVAQNDAIRRESFGARLLDPQHGDVIFRFPDNVKANHEEKMLFASSDLLYSFATYFKQCTSSLFPSDLMSVLQGEFRDSTLQSWEYQVNYNNDLNINLPALRVKNPNFYRLNLVKTSLSGNRKVISVRNARFTDYHNILYYIYTGSLNLRFPPSGKEARPLSSSGWDVAPGFPRPANANEIYRLAGMMGLVELQTRAYHYLMSTCSVENIFDRLFDPYCKSTTHAAVRSVYQNFLASNWTQIRQSGQWGLLLKRYRSTQSDDEANFLLEAMCEILNAVTWDHKLTNLLPQP